MSPPRPRRGTNGDRLLRLRDAIVQAPASGSMCSRRDVNPRFVCVAMKRCIRASPCPASRPAQELGLNPLRALRASEGRPRRSLPTLARSDMNYRMIAGSVGARPSDRGRQRVEICDLRVGAAQQPLPVYQGFPWCRHLGERLRSRNTLATRRPFSRALRRRSKRDHPRWHRVLRHIQQSSAHRFRPARRNPLRKEETQSSRFRETPSSCPPESRNCPATPRRQSRRATCSTHRNR